MIRSWTPTGLARDPLLTVFDHDTQVNCVQLYDSLVLSGGENGTIALHDSRQSDAAIMLCDVDDPITSMKWVKILHLSAMSCSVKLTLFVMYRLFLLWLFRLFLFIFSFQKAKILL